MTHFYLTRILDPLFRFAWLHVPWFADYCVEFVNQVERRVHGKMMTPGWIERARETLAKEIK